MSTYHEFRVGWATLDPDLKKDDGFVHILVVDDYTANPLWDALIYKGVPLIGSCPAGLAHKHRGLPTANWDMLNVMYTMATDGLYARGGITKPSFGQLPAVYALKHGQPIGHNVFNVTLEKAVEFIKAQL